MSSTSLEEILRQAKLKSLVHFTPISNLGSILDHGLLARSVLRERRLECEFLDTLRLECLTNYVCVTLNEPNRFLLRSAIKPGPKMNL